MRQLLKRLFYTLPLVFIGSLATMQGHAAELNDASTIDSGWFHACALTKTGGVKCWGNNAYGQLGDNSTKTHLTPVDVTGLPSDVSAIAAGGGHTCAITAAGGVKCWGQNNQGQLGDNSQTVRWTPVNVMGLASGVSAIDAGNEHTCALTQAGAVKCWGDYKQIFPGYRRLSPVDVEGLSSGVSAIATGSHHSCALTTAGGVKCWGYNDHGELGDNSTTSRTRAPVDVTGLAGVVAIAAGDFHTCALTQAGGVKCWGYNFSGQLGNNSRKTNLTPVDVTGLARGVSAIAAGGSNTCALTVAGAVKCWGKTWDGTDDGNLDSRTREEPEGVMGLAKGVSAITVGVGYFCALNTSGGVKCIGDNQSGQLGDNSTTPTRYVPGVNLLNLLKRFGLQ